MQNARPITNRLLGVAPIPALVVGADPMLGTVAAPEFANDQVVDRITEGKDLVGGSFIGDEHV